MFGRPFVRGFVCASCRRHISTCKPTPTRPQIYNQSRAHSTKTSKLLPESPARTRFAPSPTGFLHLGSLRTALFNYLLAKRTGGKFLLRLEDTDRKRTVEDAEDRLYQDLEGIGLHWDEGPQIGGPYGPYRQSDRTELYREHAQKLLDTGHAYRCFCSAERLNDLAAQRAKLGLPTDYDRTCASTPKDQSDDRAEKGEPFVVRLRAPDIYPEFTDIVYGRVGRANTKSNRHLDFSYDDPILLKSDGLPTYHLANVVDDHHMKITHVVRGTEWMTATPKHLAMYEAFGWTAPKFAHVGLLQNEDGSKLSKRSGDVDVETFLRNGILPEALVNFVALLGWAGNPGGSEVLSMDELIEKFNMKFTKGNTTVNLGKLDFLQRQHAKAIIEQGGDAFVELVGAVSQAVDKVATSDLDDILGGRDQDQYVAALLRADAKNFTTSTDFVDHSVPYMFHGFHPSAEAAKAALLQAPSGTLDTLKQLRYKLEELPEEAWHTLKLKECIDACIADVAALQGPSTPSQETQGEGTRDSKQLQAQATKVVYQCLRGALTDNKHGAPLADVMEILGKKESTLRVRRWFALVEDGQSGMDFTLSEI